MGDIKYANVVFERDNIDTIVPIEYIRETKSDKDHIVPLDDTNFNPHHLYYTRWYYCGKKGIKCIKKHTHDYKTHGAKIYHLGGRTVNICLINFTYLNVTER